MFQFTGLPSRPYVFRHGHARITVRRFPHSEIPGSMDGQLLTRAYRSRPRPSSAPGAKASTVCSLSLDHEEHRVCRYGVFKVRAGDPARERRPRPVSQNSTACSGRRGRRSSRRAWASDETVATETSTSQAPAGVGAPGFPRKEVIQPQLPLRLPCYDFTPITNPTFDGSLPCGLGHRLRVLPAFVV
jgi:hypothetical protein